MPPSQPTNQNLEAAFGCSLLDPSGQANLVINSPGEERLIWKLVNNVTGAGQNLVITPFGSGTVSPSQYHFAFNFVPGALTAKPKVDGWDVAVEADGQGGIKTLYLALIGSTALSIPPAGSNSVTWTYTKAIQENSGSSAVSVTATAGANVALAGKPIQNKSFGPFDLTLVPAGTLPAAPISVDFVGRRTVLNDGRTPNGFTFALTNLSKQSIPVTPKPEAMNTVFTVSFDAAPNDPQESYSWALAQVQHLADKTVALAPPSSDWNVDKQVTLLEEPHVVPGNPQWALTANKPVNLLPQTPLIFTFSGIITDLDPGVTHMYLRYQNLPGFADGYLVARLEKSPVLYGTTRGQGLYLSAGTHTGPTPPTLNFDGGLYVKQFDAKPAATLSGGTGLLVDGPSKLLGATTVGNPEGPAENSPGLSVGGALTVAGQTTLGKKLVVTPSGNVGIGTTSPQHLLELGGDVRGVGLAPSEASPNAGYVRWGDNTGWKLHFGRSREGSGGTLNAGTNGVLVTMQDNGNVGVGTLGPARPLHVSTPGSDVLLLQSTRGGPGNTTNLDFQTYATIGQTYPTASVRAIDDGHYSSHVALLTKDTGANTNALSERVRISSDGNVGIGTASPGAKLDVAGNLLLSGNYNITTRRGLLMMGTTDDTAAIEDEVVGAIGFVGFRQQHGQLSFRAKHDGQGQFELVDRSKDYPSLNYKRGQYDYADLQLLRLGTMGWSPAPRTQGWGGGIHTWDVEAEGTIWSQHGYKEGSDARAKTNVTKLTDVLGKVRAIRGVSFNRIGAHRPAAQTPEHRDIGVIAQEVEEVFPELVSTHGEEGYKAVDYSGLTGVLIEAAKELLVKNEELERRMEALEQASSAASPA